MTETKTTNGSTRSTEALHRDRPLTEKTDASLPAPYDLQRAYLHAATADNTRRAYRSAIRHFERWGGRLPTTCERLIDYLLAYADSLNPRTLAVRVTALSQWHQYQGFADPAGDPTVRKTLEGIRRTHGQPKRQAPALRLDHVAALLAYLGKLPQTKKRSRDLALIQVGFFGAFRRSELVSIRVEHLYWEPEGVNVVLPRSKTDPYNEGLNRALPYGSGAVCPVSALKTWIEVAAIDCGPVFRPVNRWDQVQPRALNSGAINAILKNAGEGCGFNFATELSSHSFRRGLATAAARAQVDFESIKRQGGWRHEATVWGYIEEGRRFADNATVPLMKNLAALMRADTEV